MFEYPRVFCFWMLAFLTFGNSAFGYKFIDYSVDPIGKAIGKTILWKNNSEKAEEGVAFLIGDNHILTNAHLAKWGPSALGNTYRLAFHWQYKFGGFSADSPWVKDVFAWGGGYQEDEELKGRDWAILTLDRNVGVNGTQNSAAPLSNHSLTVGQTVWAYGYVKGVNSGDSALWQECQVVPLPEQSKKFCTKNIDGTFNCNFFAHNCEVDKEGFDSGSPIAAFFDAQERDQNGTMIKKTVMEVVGVHAAKGDLKGVKLKSGGIGIRTWNWAITVNEAEDMSANVFFHFLNMKVYEKLNRLSPVLANAKFEVNLKDEKGNPIQSVDIMGPMSAMMRNWWWRTDDQRIAEIQSFDTVDDQKFLDRFLTILDDFVFPRVGQTRPQELKLHIDTPIRGHVGKVQTGRYYKYGVVQNFPQFQTWDYPQTQSDMRLAEQQQQQLKQVLQQMAQQQQQTQLVPLYVPINNNPAPALTLTLVPSVQPQPAPLILQLQAAGPVAPAYGPAFLVPVGQPMVGSTVTTTRGRGFFKPR